MENFNWNLHCAARVYTWLSALPAHPAGFLGADVPPYVSLYLYKDYLSYSGEYAIKQTQKDLEECELEYRRVGLSYHRLPLSHRSSLSDSQALFASSVAKQSTKSLQYLNTLFGLRERNQRYTFFKHWFQVKNSILDMQRLMSTTSNSKEHLHSVCEELEGVRDACTGFIQLIRRALAEADKAVDIASWDVRRDRYGSGSESMADLADRSSEEGKAYRLWVATFPEVESGEVSADLAEQTLRLLGPEGSVGLRSGRVGFGENRGGEDRA